MVVFIDWVFGLLFEIVAPIASNIMALIDYTFNSAHIGDYLTEINFNLYLFSDNLILSMNMYDFILLIISLLVSFVAVRVIWKVLKKVFRRLFFWGRW